MSTFVAKFRQDIDWKEATKCCTDKSFSDALNEKLWKFTQEKLKVVVLFSESIESSPAYNCSGPFFRVANRPNAVLCVHVLDLND